MSLFRQYNTIKTFIDEKNFKDFGATRILLKINQTI